MPDFQSDLEAGKKYEKFVYDFFEKEKGVVIKPIEGYSESENNKGLEVKYDRRMNATGNLYIEVADRLGGGGGIWRRESNTRWWIIGDYRRAWVIPVERLQQAAKENKYYRVHSSTSTGYLLPSYKADKMCVAKYYFANVEEAKSE